MQCQKHKDLLESWWNDQLTETGRATLRAQLVECEDCRRELEGSRELWNLMGAITVPEPSGEMQANFSAMLESYKASVEGAGRPARVGMAGFWRLLTGQPWIAAAFSLILIAGGFGIGYMTRQPEMVFVSTVSPPAAPVQRVESVDTAQRVALEVKQRQSAGTAGRQEAEDAGQRQQLEALTTQVHEMK